jgi:hypothetical protein
MKAEFGGIRSRSDEVRSAERRQEVVERSFVRQIDDRETQAHLVAVVATKQIVVTRADIEQITRGDARWIVIVVFGPRSRKANAGRVIQRRIATSEWRRQCRYLGSADQPSLNLLVGSYPSQVHGSAYVRHRDGARDQAVVIPPIHGDPWPVLLRLVLHVCGLLKFLVVVDAERAFRRKVRPQSSHLRIKEPGIHPAEHHERRQTVVVRNARANRKPADLGPFPGDRKENRAIEEHTKVVSIARVFPEIVAVDDQKSSERLLEPAVKLVSLAGPDRARRPENAREDAGRIPETSDDQVFVEGSFQNPGVGNPQHGVRRLNVVGYTQSKFDLAVLTDTAVDIAAHTEVERPIARSDCVLQIERHFLDVGVAMKPKEITSTGQVKWEQ